MLYGKKLLTKLARWWAVIAFSGSIILILFIVSAIFIQAHFHEDYIVSATGRHNLDFRVFYLDNIIFDDNPIPQHLDFLMSYTDFIEVDSSFLATFNTEMDMYYSYRAVKRFIIRPMATADLYRLIFEEVFVLSEISGTTTASQLVFGLENDGSPGGSYTIFPKEHIELYFTFVQDQARQMVDEGVVAHGLRGFTAELLIDFTYTIRVPEFDINETVTQGYRISLTTEIYSFVVTGFPTFNWQTNLATRDVEITLPMALLLVVLFTLCLLGLLYNIKKLMANPNVHRQEADSILRKYAPEIVIYDKPVELNRYAPRTVQEFRELLKLAINLNRHIMCYRDESHTEFAVIVDEFACIYVINYDEAVTVIAEDYVVVDEAHEHDESEDLHSSDEKEE